MLRKINADRQSCAHAAFTGLASISCPRPITCRPAGAEVFSVGASCARDLFGRSELRSRPLR